MMSRFQNLFDAILVTIVASIIILCISYPVAKIGQKLNAKLNADVRSSIAQNNIAHALDRIANSMEKRKP